jgi:hypothetical protein
MARVHNQLDCGLPTAPAVTPVRELKPDFTGETIAGLPKVDGRLRRSEDRAILQLDAFARPTQLPRVMSLSCGRSPCGSWGEGDASGVLAGGGHAFLNSSAWGGRSS